MSQKWFSFLLEWVEKQTHDVRVGLDVEKFVVVISSSILWLSSGSRLVVSPCEIMITYSCVCRTASSFLEAWRHDSFDWQRVNDSKLIHTSFPLSLFDPRTISKAVNNVMMMLIELCFIKILWAWWIRCGGMRANDSQISPLSFKWNLLFSRWHRKTDSRFFSG